MKFAFRFLTTLLFGGLLIACPVWKEAVSMQSVGFGVAATGFCFGMVMLFWKLAEDL